MGWDRYGYVISSSHRRSIVKELEGKPRTPSELADRLDLAISHVSQLLKGLSERGVVECLNPEERKGRLYGLTDDGRWVLERLD